MSALRVVNPGSRLDELAAIVNAEHSHVWRAGRVALEHAVRCGKALLEAQSEVPRGQWLRWLADNVAVHPTSAYKYMRLARFEDKVLAAGVEGVEQGLRLVATESWHDRSRLSDADKSEMRRLAEDHSLDEIAEAFGVARSTVWRWTSGKSPASRPASVSQAMPARARLAPDTEIDDALIERTAAWLSERYRLPLDDGTRGDALELLGVVLGAAA